MIPIILAAPSPLGIVGTAAAQSIGKYAIYYPIGILAAIVVGVVLVIMRRKSTPRMGMMFPTMKSSSGGTIGGGLPSMAHMANYAIIYSMVQRRIFSIRPFSVDRKKDASGNILEKKAVFLDTQPGTAGRLGNVTAVFGRIFGRQTTPAPVIRDEIDFDENLAIGNQYGGWAIFVDLEHNIQMNTPFIVEGEAGNSTQKQQEKVKAILDQTDKRIARLKDAALSVNQYASSAEMMMRNAYTKSLMLLGVLLLASVIVWAYTASQNYAAVTSVAHIMANTTRALASLKLAP